MHSYILYIRKQTCDGVVAATTTVPGILVVDFVQAPTPLPLMLLGLPSGCFGYLASPQSVGFSFTDADGRLIFGVGLPNNPGLAGLSVLFQGAMLDPQTSSPLPFHSSNALELVIQP